MSERIEKIPKLDAALAVLAILLIALLCTTLVLGMTQGNSQHFEDFTLFFTPSYDPHIHPLYPGQEDSLPTSPGGSCTVEITVRNVLDDQILSGIVVVAQDLVTDTSATLYLSQALYVGPNVLLPKKEVSLGSFLIGFATRDQSLPCTLSLSYDITWETLDGNGLYTGTHHKRGIPLTVVLPPVTQ